MKTFFTLILCLICFNVYALSDKEIDNAIVSAKKIGGAMGEIIRGFTLIKDLRERGVILAPAQKQIFSNSYSIIKQKAVTDFQTLP